MNIVFQFINCYTEENAMYWLFIYELQKVPMSRTAAIGIQDFSTLIEKGVPEANIYTYGLAFQGKTVLIVRGRYTESNTGNAR